MSTTYCREDCRTCEWVATTLEGVRPYWFCDAEGVFGDSEALRYCPACGTRLLPDGETEEMVSRKVAVSALEVCGRRCLDCDAHYHCPQLESDHGPYDVTLRQCAERRLAWAERQAAGGRPE